MSHLKNMKGFLLAVMVVSSVYAHAERDFGDVNCGEWLEHRKGEISINQVSDMRWIGGYLSGLNTAWSATALDPLKDPLNELQSLLQAFAWMDNYCREKPLGSVKLGAVQLFSELVDRKRKKENK